jgi:hypothetical protein
VAAGFVEDGALTVRTTFAKTLRAYVIPVIEGAAEVVGEWITELHEAHRWG